MNTKTAQYRNSEQLINELQKRNDKMNKASSRCKICNSIKEKSHAEKSDICDNCFKFLSKYGSSVSNIETLIYHYEVKVLSKQRKMLALYAMKNFDYDFELN